MTTQAEVLKQIRNAEEKLTLADAVERLQVNKDFILVFSNHLFNEHILEVVNGIHEYEPTSPEHKNAVAELECVSRVQAYLKNLIDKGQWARSDLLEAKSIPDSELI